MAKSFDDEFYYDYKPKDRKDNIDIDVDDIFSSNTGRDISSYTKGAGTKSAPATKTPTRPAATRKPAAKKPAVTANKPNIKEQGKKAANAVLDTYGNFCFKNLGNIIKVISFVVAFGIIILSLILALTLFKARTGLTMLSLLTIIGGTAFAAIVFFPLYGIGHIICQNNEILRIFNDK